MQSLGNIAEHIISNSQRNHSLADVFLKWEEIVGKQLALISEPYKIVEVSAGKILILKIKQGCAIELQHESLTIISLINKYFKETPFTAIRVIQN